MIQVKPEIAEASTGLGALCGHAAQHDLPALQHGIYSALHKALGITTLLGISCFAGAIVTGA
jgi:hypothetical protein